MATELEDITSIPLYGSYSRSRYGFATAVSDGPLEEAVATWAEVEFARSVRGRGTPKPPGYLRAVREINRQAPPGYRDFEVVGASHPEFV